MNRDNFDIKLFFTRKKLIYIISLFAAINFFLFAIKFVPTIVCNVSISLRSDAFNSLADFGYSILILIGIYFSYKPRDKSHPHGHGRIKPFISLLISISIILTGIIIVKDAIEFIFLNKPITVNLSFIIVLIISILLKLLMYRYSINKSREMDNDILKSIAKDSKADVGASSSALFGVIGAYFGIGFLDPIFGLIVSIWIFKTGIEIAKRNIGYLTGVAPPKEETEKIKKILDCQGFQSCKIEPHYVGPKINVYLEIEINEELSFREAHKLEEDIKSKIESLNEVDTVYVHLEPVLEGKDD